MEGQAMCLTDTLRNSRQGVGIKLKEAETEEQAHAALKDFWAVVQG